MSKKPEIDPGHDTLDGADVCDTAPEPEDETEVTQQPAARKPRTKTKKKREDTDGRKLRQMESDSRPERV